MIPKKVDTVNIKGMPTHDAETSLLDLMHAVMHRVRSLGSQGSDAPALQGLTPMEGRVLGFFARHPGATLGDVVRHSGRDKAQLARLIKALRERELLQAQEPASDRRQVRLSLTAHGGRVQQALRQQAQALEQRALAGLDREVQAQLRQGLLQMQANLDADDHAKD